MARIVFFHSGSVLALSLLYWIRDEQVDEVVEFTCDDKFLEMEITSIKSFNPELGVSVLYREIVPKDILDLFPLGVVNLHPSYLPHNRGAYPNVWPLIDGSPAGVTLHLMDEGIDTGPILLRRRVLTEPTDTGKTLYDRLMGEAELLFKMGYPAFKRGQLKGIPQSEFGKGSTHWTDAVGEIDHLSRAEPYEAGEIINRLRARTFPPHRGCYFLDNERKPVYLRLELYRED